MEDLKLVRDYSHRARVIYDACSTPCTIRELRKRINALGLKLTWGNYAGQSIRGMVDDVLHLGIAKALMPNGRNLLFHSSELAGLEAFDLQDPVSRQVAADLLIDLGRDEIAGIVRTCKKITTREFAVGDLSR